MAKNIYTLQHYKMKINNKEVWHFQAKGYSTDWNALHHFGEGICKGLRPCIEEFQISRKEAIKRKKEMEEYMLKTGREIYDQEKYGIIYMNWNWTYDETEGAYIGTLAEA